MGFDRMNEKYLARSKDVASRVVGGEIAIMSAVDSTLFVLNEVATEIWLAADGRTSLSEIVEHKLCEEFEVNPEVAYLDAEEFVNVLAAHGILKTSAHPFSAPFSDLDQTAAEAP
jgi:hypothetical protein